MFKAISLFLGLLFLASSELIFNGMLPYALPTITPTLSLSAAQAGVSSYVSSASTLSSGSSLYSSGNSYIGSTVSSPIILKGSLPAPQAASTTYYQTMTAKANYYPSQPTSAAVSLTSNSINPTPTQSTTTYSSSKSQVPYVRTAQSVYNPTSFGSNILSNGMTSISSAVIASPYAKDPSIPVASASSSGLTIADSTSSYDFSSVSSSGSSPATA